MDRHEACAMALTEAYEQYADAIFRHCYFRVARRERAQDLMQETFVKTWAYLADGHEVDNLRAFLYRVANNLIVDMVRRSHGPREISLEVSQEEGFDPAIDLGPEMQDQIDGAAALAAVRDLEERYRSVLVMRYVDELMPEEIAHVTGETANAVSVRLHRAKETLRKRLNYA